TMNEFLKKIESPEIRSSYQQIDQYWDNRVNTLNQKLANKKLPVKIVNMVSVWTILYTVPSRYNWMYQFYLRAQGLAISWVGSGRIIMSHDFSDQEYELVMNKMVAAAEEMENDGWWWKSESLTNKSIKKQIVSEIVTSFIHS
ncbi:MAG: glutamate-1-semialdehyde 2,1-aminomutase, partial [Gammaproteobacteria bacterium]|nr:glutamate-1-semialdehyde 2,1-aminomutase [Gammaproteobacteria bacterium]